MSRLGRAAVLATMLLTALTGCGIWGMEGGPAGAGGAAPTAATASAATPTVLGADGVQRIDIHVGDDLRFTPSVVQAGVGTIEFTFHNDGLTPHDVRVDAPAASGTGNLNGGASATIRVTVDRVGTYPFPCLYHSTSGMQGTLIVAAG